MPTAGMVFILFSESYLSFIPLSAKKTVVLLVATGTMILPAIMVPLFKMNDLISDLHVKNQKERIMPLGITLVFFIVTYIFFIRIPVFRFIHSYILGCCLSVLAIFLLNFRWKISAHSMALGGLSALVAGFSYYINTGFPITFLSLILLSGVVASSRLYLTAHRQFEVYVGWATGFLVMLGCLLFY
jgi:hypothetical protein